MNIKKRENIKETQKVTQSEIQEFEHRVVEYLKVKKDFFAHHPALLTELFIPHPSGDAISLVERQLALLREQNRHLKGQLHELIENAKANDSLNKKVQQLVLATLTASTPQGMLEALFASLRADFSVDVLTLWLFLEDSAFPSSLREHPEVIRVPPDSPELATFSGILKHSRPVCGRLTGEQRQALFGRAAQSTVSCALIPLPLNRCKGLFAMGSREPERFHPDLGTSFLDFLGAVIARALQHHEV